MSDDFFKRFKEIEEQKIREPKPRIVNILWSDPYGHFSHLLDRLGTKGTYVYNDPGVEFMMTDNVRIFYTGTNPELIPNEDFDICVTRRAHREGMETDIKDAVRAEVLPFSEHAKYTVYGDCCHGKGMRLAEMFGVTHPVSESICLEVLAEMIHDLIKGDDTYINFGTRFAEAAYLALQRGDKRKHELYQKFDRDKDK